MSGSLQPSTHTQTSFFRLSDSSTPIVQSMSIGHSNMTFNFHTNEIREILINVSSAVWLSTRPNPPPPPSPFPFRLGSVDFRVNCLTFLLKVLKTTCNIPCRLSTTFPENLILGPIRYLVFATIAGLRSPADREKLKQLNHNSCVFVRNLT